jgi:hypothetical protein
MRFLKRTLMLVGLHLVVLSGILHAQTNDREVAYLQTDRTSYISGEKIYYKLYLLDQASKKRSDISTVGYILLRSAGSNPCLKLRVKINDGLSSGSILLPDTLTSGAYQLVAYSGIMRNTGEQCFFHKEITIANRFDKELDFKIPLSTLTETSLTENQVSGFNIKTDKNVYHVCEKVLVSLSKLKSKANVAISVFEDPEITTPDKSITETLQEFTLAKPDKEATSSYIPENIGKILRGRVIDSSTGKYVKSATVLLSCIDTIPNLEYALSDSNGLFQLLLTDYYEGKELFLTIKDSPENQHWKIVIEDEFAQHTKWNPVLNYGINKSKEFIEKSQNIVYINKCYRFLTDTTDNSYKNINIICPRVYNCPVTKVFPSEFVPLNDFQEIAVELLPFVSVNKEKGIYHVHVTSTSTENLKYNAAVFLDGVFVDDMNKIAILGSEQIKKIEFLDTERTFGDLVFQGIVSIISKLNEIQNTIPASYSLRIKNDKVYKTDRYVSVNSTIIQNKNIPLYKQLLYWNPDVEINGTDSTEFEFYTSDNIANYIIKVEGISDDGIPISLSSRFQVNNSINSNDK